VPGWLQLLGLGVAAFGATAAINRSTKTWDGDVERYRGDDGRFRSGALFR
jgi:hypothetical protein